MNRQTIHAALDAYARTHGDIARCSSAEVREIAAEREHDLSWTVVACVVAALEAAEETPA